VDWTFINANVLTLDPARPRAEAVVVRDGRISAVGDRRIADGSVLGSACLVDCRGKTITPGFIDPHFHLLAFARGLAAHNLESLHGATSLSDIRSRIRRLAGGLPPGTWIRGWGYHEFHLAEKRHPDRRGLDEATAVHPVALTHRSGGAHVLNSLALALMGISAKTPDPPEGLIDRDLTTGEPTGLLYGMGDDLEKKLPPPDPERLEQGIALANRELCSLGITSLCDVSARNDRARRERIRDWKQRGILRPKIRMALGWEGFAAFLKAPFPAPPDAPRLAGVKIIVHETTGRLSPSRDELNERVLRIHRADLQAHLHAIEETAIGAACDAVEYALGHLPRPDHRHRIEHCSVCPPPLARRIASLGIVVVTQPPFVYFNGDRYLETVPEPQANWLYPFGSLVRAGVTVAGSSDGPVVPSDPLTGIYAAVSRRTEQGASLLPQEGLTPEEALRMYTVRAAQAGFDEAAQGVIAPGRAADLVVLDGDPTAVPVEEIRKIRVEMTLIDGEVVWERDTHCQGKVEFECSLNFRI
jgi:predicted amidohydrolase YtcJ